MKICSSCPSGTTVKPGQGITVDDCKPWGKLFIFQFRLFEIFKKTTRMNRVMCGIKQ